MPGTLKTAAAEITLGIIREDDGGYSAIALNLPGAGSCGETEAEAVENAREAIRAVLDVYAEDGDAVPWHQFTPADVPASATLKRISLDA